jgi:hypothetical protein
MPLARELIELALGAILRIKSDRKHLSFFCRVSPLGHYHSGLV